MNIRIAYALMAIVMVSFIIFTKLSVTEVHIKENIVAAYYHENNRYSVIIEKDKELISVGMPSSYDIKTKIYTDVKEGESIWYEAKYKTDHFSGIQQDGDQETFVHIHIRSIDDLATGDWNHGKFGTGTTTKISK